MWFQLVKVWVWDFWILNWLQLVSSGWSGRYMDWTEMDGHVWIKSKIPTILPQIKECSWYPRIQTSSNPLEWSGLYSSPVHICWRKEMSWKDNSFLETHYAYALHAVSTSTLLVYTSKVYLFNLWVQNGSPKEYVEKDILGKAILGPMYLSYKWISLNQWWN